MKDVQSILVVDDDMDSLYAVTSVAKRHFPVVIGSYLGKNGLTEVKRYAPDLILCDYHMPEVDGLALLQAIRANPETRHIPFVLFSSDPTTTAQEEARAAGADAFLQVPFSPEELVDAVRQVHPVQA